MYRVHDAPDPDKVEALRIFLEEAGIPGLALAQGHALKPELFNRVLRRAAGTPEAALVNDLVLRCQAQAAYSPNNIGHFGLALRRYADLLVHRALLGEIGQPKLDAIGDHISATERRAAEAERAAIDRYRATLLAQSVGSLFAADISGVANFGLFVRLRESGADGLVPISSLPGDYYVRDERAQRLVGRSTGRVYQLGEEVLVRLVEADGIGGRLVFRIDEEIAPAIGGRTLGRSRPRLVAKSKRGRR